MFRPFRYPGLSRFLAIKFSLLLLFQLGFPSLSLGLTGGPSQPEVQSFEPVGTDQMVDPFSGDFTYNIPLMEVGNYPLNLSYHSGITMDQEASMVGLGWNLNPGAITRQKRGLPDDFKGDEIEKEKSRRINKTYGLTAGVGAELFGFDLQKLGELSGGLSLKYQMGVDYNNYKGVSFQQTLSPSFSAKTGAGLPMSGSLGGSIQGSSTGGANVSPNMSFSFAMMREQNEDMSLGLNAGLNFNTRAGVKAVTYGYSMSANRRKFLPNGDGGIERTKTNSTQLAGGSGTIDLAPTTYTPASSFPTHNASISFSTKFGGTLFGQDATFDLGGYYSEQSLKKNELSLPGFGYLYAHEAYGNSTLMDFNRDNERAFTKNSPALSVPVHTHDVFSVAAQGTGGSFRPFRSDVGSLKDPRVFNTSGSGDISVEFGSGNTAKGGGNLSVNTVESETGGWNSGDKNYLKNAFKFHGKDDKGDPLYEPAYFKKAGEKAGPVDEDRLYYMRYDHPVRPVINKGPGFQSTAESKIKDDGTTIDLGMADLDRDERESRNHSFYYLTQAEEGSETDRLGVTPYIPDEGEPHHISELHSLKSDGSRYVFGIPAYNTKEKDVTFNVSGRGGECSTGLVDYEPKDASKDNERGVDHSFRSTETPPYAHSYMLSAVLSPDYADSDGIRGPSKGDIGGYTKFNYHGNGTSTSPMVEDYKWRTPFQKKEANFREGLKFRSSKEDGDDRGSYTYGKKDLWYVTSVETKTHIALFHYSPRADAYEVKDEHGGKGSRAMQKLDSIALYPLPAYEKNGTDAEPIKKVHFQYDYILCPGAHNADNNSSELQGRKDAKLTLTGLYFTHGDSKRGKYSRYSFDYADVDHDGERETNYSYDIKGYDRWGHYKEQPDNAACDPSGSADVPNAEAPYVDQRQPQQQDKYAAAWSMTSVKIPSGGSINIDYESDDYAYVQDRRAKQMFKITGAGKVKDKNNISDGVLDANGGVAHLFDQGDHEKIHDHLYFKLMDGQLSDVKEKYLNTEEAPLYFKSLIDLNGEGAYEYVTGYLEVEKIGEVSGTAAGEDYGYIEVEEVEIGSISKDAHPIALAGWNFQRTNLPRVASGIEEEPGGGDDEVREVIEALGSSFEAYSEIFKNYYKKLGDKDHARKFWTNRSWVRLQNPNKKKLGGGARVDSLVLSDEWNEMTDGKESTSLYGKNYRYTMKDGTSSGVAQNEPIVGGDENALRRPDFYGNNKKLLASGMTNYMERPYGRSYLPSPGVGYARVVVENIHKEELDRTSTGKTVHRFYTARDFPFDVQKSELQLVPQKSNMLDKLLFKNVKDHMTASQGFSVIKNDMHGKPMSKFTYPKGKDKRSEAISGKEYIYKTSDQNIQDPLDPSGSVGKEKELSNKVPTIDEDGDVKERTIGVEHEMISSSREEKTKTFSVSSQLNLNGFLASIIPVAIPAIWPSKIREKTRFRQAVIMKEVKKYGILDRVIAWDSGSKMATENKLWDAETGNVLLTESSNSYGDPVKNFTYPAHWGYDRMGAASKNIKAEPVVTIGGNGELSSTSNAIVEGDEVLVNGEKWWVLRDDNSGDLHLIDEDGQPISQTGSHKATVIRSGRRNQQTKEIGKLTALEDPVLDTANDELAIEDTTDVLEAKAMEYSEEWGTFCGNKEVIQAGECFCNEDFTQDLKEFFNAVIQNEPVNDPNSNIEFNYLPNNAGNAPSYFIDHFVNSSFYKSMEAFCGYTVGAGNMEVDVNVDHEHASDENWIALSVGVDWPCVTPATSNEYCAIMAQEWYDYSGQSKPDIIGVSEVNDLDSSQGCSGNLNSYEVVIELDNGDSVISSNDNLDACGIPCFEYNDQDEFGDEECGLLAGDVLNPFLEGLRGTWHKERDWLYLADRDPMTASTDTALDVRDGGIYEDFSPFWEEPTSGTDWQKDTTGWIWKQRVTERHPDGPEVENEDALGRHSAALYGYKGELAKAVSKNSRYRQIAYEGFEDHGFYSEDDGCNSHFGMLEHKGERTKEEHHTGRYSVQLDPWSSIEGGGELINTSCTDGTDNVPYTLKECDCIGAFGPRTGETKDYLLSFWVKENDSSVAPLFDHDAVGVSVTNGSQKLHSKSKVIDGWQKRDYTFTIPQGASGGFSIQFTNTSNTRPIYLDDIRVTPFNGSMRSFVYDPLNLRYVAELDQNNFATFYEYDQEGNLVRIKKETEEGIKTVQESREHKSHKAP